jgi:hypothetical protein
VLKSPIAATPPIPRRAEQGRSCRRRRFLLPCVGHCETQRVSNTASFEQSGGELTFFLRSRGSQVRIYAEARKDGKRLGEPSLYYEINEWGELRPIAIRMEAVLNSCAGFQGPIWLMPGEPGYRRHASKTQLTVVT